METKGSRDKKTRQFSEGGNGLKSSSWGAVLFLFPATISRGSLHIEEVGEIQLKENNFQTGKDVINIKN